MDRLSLRGRLVLRSEGNFKQEAAERAEMGRVGEDAETRRWGEAEVVGS